MIQVGDLAIETAQNWATRSGKSLELTAREHAVLSYMAERAGNIVSRSELLMDVWGMPETAASSNVVDVYMGYLRRKLGEPNIIHTVRGEGYKLACDPTSELAQGNAPSGA